MTAEQEMRSNLIKAMAIYYERLSKRETRGQLGDFYTPNSCQSWSKNVLRGRDNITQAMNERSFQTLTFDPLNTEIEVVVGATGQALVEVSGKVLIDQETQALPYKHTLVFDITSGPFSKVTNPHIAP